MPHASPLPSSKNFKLTHGVATPYDGFVWLVKGKFLRHRVIPAQVGNDGQRFNTLINSNVRTYAATRIRPFGWRMDV